LLRDPPRLQSNRPFAQAQWRPSRRWNEGVALCRLAGFRKGCIGVDDANLGMRRRRSRRFRGPIGDSSPAPSAAFLLELPSHLFVSLPESTLPSSVRVSQLALALPEDQRVPSGPGSLFNRRPDCRLALTWTWAGYPRFPGDPSCAFASFQDPGRTDAPSPI
jgi:hypothetical protein